MAWLPCSMQVCCPNSKVRPCNGLAPSSTCPPHAPLSALSSANAMAAQMSARSTVSTRSMSSNLSRCGREWCREGGWRGSSEGNSRGAGHHIPSILMVWSPQHLCPLGTAPSTLPKPPHHPALTCRSDSGMSPWSPRPTAPPRCAAVWFFSRAGTTPTVMGGGIQRLDLSTIWNMSTRQLR